MKVLFSLLKRWKNSENWCRLVHSKKWIMLKKKCLCPTCGKTYRFTYQGNKVLFHYTGENMYDPDQKFLQKYKKESHV